MEKKSSPGSYHDATASADMVRMLFTYLEHRKIDPQMLERVSGIKLHGLKRRIPVSVVNRLWRTGQVACNDPDFGLHLGEAFVQLAQGHLLFSVMRYSPTFGVALEKFFRYHSLMADSVQPRAVTVADTVHCVLDRKYTDLPLERHHVESTFTIIYGSLKSLSGTPVPLTEVVFCHEKPSSTEELSRVFNAPLHFECPEERLVFQKAVLEKPIHSADQVYLSAHESLAEDLLNGLEGEGRFETRVTALVERTLLKGDPPKIAHVAKELAVSIRKLQQSLQNEGVSFREIVNDTRKRLAKRYLRKPDATLCDVAFLLGFSEQSAFNHAFRRWTGRTPREYREAMSVDSRMNRD
jgi:AraC-like DNA-binding protein